VGLDYVPCMIIIKQIRIPRISLTCVFEGLEVTYQNHKSLLHIGITTFFKYVRGLISFASTVIFLFTLDISE